MQRPLLLTLVLQHLSLSEFIFLRFSCPQAELFQASFTLHIPDTTCLLGRSNGYLQQRLKPTTEYHPVVFFNIDAVIDLKNLSDLPSLFCCALQYMFTSISLSFHISPFLLILLQGTCDHCGRGSSVSMPRSF